MPKKRRGRQLGRALRLLRKFHYSENGATIRELCDEFAASRRTIYRDLEMLERSGFKFEKVEAEEPGDLGRWRFTSGQRRQLDSSFNDQELVSLYFCLNLLAPLKGTPLREGLESVLTKVEESFSAKERDYYSDLIFTHVAKMGPSKDYARWSSTLGVISRACMEKRKINLTYGATADEEPKTYLFHPYCLAWWSGDLYTVGHSELRRAVRTLRLDRVEKCELTTQKFTRPRDFDPEDYLGRSFGMYSEGALTRVRVEFSGLGAKMIKGKEWHPTQRIEERKGGRVVLSMSVQGLPDVARWVLFHAPFARAIEPPELKRLVIDYASAVKKRHS
jgi:predicted DNA-binding transcriptional regulator YafY